MENKRNLRQADFFSGLIFIIFGLFIAYLATKMPMTASYGGVVSHWYVAPALFPLFIGFITSLLGAVLIYIAIKANGFKNIISSITIKNPSGVSEEKIRVYIVVFSFISFIYIFIPYVDFYISIVLFLFFLCIAFYPESKLIRNHVSLLFAAENIIILFFVITGAAGYYGVDYIALIFSAANILYSFKLARRIGIPSAKIRIVLYISLITPLILCPVFRYFLIVPLPKEGIVIELMNSIYYAIKY